MAERWLAPSMRFGAEGQLGEGVRRDPCDVVVVETHDGGVYGYITWNLSETLEVCCVLILTSGSLYGQCHEHGIWNKKYS